MCGCMMMNVYDAVRCIRTLDMQNIQLDSHTCNDLRQLVKPSRWSMMAGMTVNSGRDDQKWCLMMVDHNGGASWWLMILNHGG